MTDSSAATEPEAPTNGPDKEGLDNKPSAGCGPLVAIDLGSNSFHLLAAELRTTVDGRWRLHPRQRLGRKVQLGLDMQGGQLCPRAVERGLACLEEFAPFLQELPSRAIRVVATQALRQADNCQAFTGPAEQLLGVPVDIISGEEEAELVYLGVIDALPAGPGELSPARLVADIGGGSSELVVGSGESLECCHSVAVGCVSLLGHFPAGEISEASLVAAYQAARQAFGPVAGQLHGRWRQAVGCSGTLQAVEQVLIQQGWSNGGIDRSGLAQLRAAILGFKQLERVEFQGLSEDRRGVFATGLVIVEAMFDCFAIESMSISEAALREGVAHRLAAQLMAANL